MVFTSAVTNSVWAASSDDENEEAAAVAEETVFVQSSSSVTLTKTDESKWTEKTEDGRSYLEGTSGAEITASVPEAGWLIFDWMMTEGSWNEKFAFNNPEKSWPDELKANNDNDWSTKVVKFDKAESVSWKAETSEAKVRLSNVRFTSEQIQVKCNVQGNGAVSINGGSNENSEAFALADPGSDVTFTATETSGDVFKEWQDASGNTLATSTTYSTGICDEALNIKAVFESVFDGSGTAEDPYRIKNLSDLEKLASVCTGGNSLAGKVLRLESDIVVDSSFKGIGGAFGGTFDGNDKKISGFMAETRGLFEKTEKSSVIKNLTVDADITASDSQSGIIAGSSNGLISDCNVSGSITSEYKNIGGITGYASAGGIEKCSFAGKIKSSYTGGHIGSNTGGIVGGLSYGVKVTECTASGIMTGDAEYFADAGGIAGTQGSSSDIKRCISFMNISGNKNLGGIVGSTASAKIADCYSDGKISGNENIGGIAGSNESDVEIINNYSLAQVIASTGAAGGLVGYTEGKGTIKESVALNKSVSGSTVGRIAGENKSNWSGGTTALKGNYAFSTMTMKQGSASYSPGAANRGDESLNGVDIDGDTLKDETAAAVCFASWNSDTWTIEPGKLPILKAVDASLQSSELPGYLTGKAEPMPDPSPDTDDDSDAVTDELKDALLASGETNLEITAVKNLKAVDGKKIVVHNGGNSTYPSDVYAGGEGLIVRTVNAIPAQGQDTSEGSFTVEWRGSGYLLFDHYVLSDRGGDRYYISVDGAEDVEFTSGTHSLYDNWKTASYHVEGTDTQKHTAKVKYERSKWGSDEEQCVLFDKVRLVKSADEMAAIDLSVSAGADEAGCTVTYNTENISSVTPGSDVTFTAAVKQGSGWIFNGWKSGESDSSYLSNDASYTVTVYDSSVKLFAEFEKPFDGNGTEESPYLINGYNDLKKLADKVNSGTEYTGCYFKQTADIDLLGKIWKPIGGTDTSDKLTTFKLRRFAGIFDGNGKTISNMMAIGEQEAGLFGRTADGSVLKNITIVDSQAAATITDSAETNKSYVGLILGMGGSSISDCIVKNCKATGIVNVGGIVGIASYMGESNAVIENCGVENTLVMATGVWDNAYAAGIAGKSTSVKIRNCWFTGKVTGYGRYVAGITGNTFCDVTGCYVKADVTSYASEKSNIDANAVGGIIASATAGNVTDCYVVGNITGGRTNVGGIIGKMSGDVKIDNCYVVGDVTGNTSTTGGLTGSSVRASSDDPEGAHIKNSVFIGEKITINKEADSIGRITGSNDEKKPVVLEGNYSYEGTVLSSNGVSVAVENKGADKVNGADLTKTQINAAASAEVFSKWSRDIWTIESGKLPVLKNIEKSVQTGEIPEFAKTSSSGGHSSSGGSSSGGSGNNNSSNTNTGNNTQTPSADTSSSFTDVSSGSWYSDVVKKVTEKKIMSGVSAKSFAPEKTFSRAMLVQVLYNMENKPDAASASFTDVKQGAWYKDAVAWASANKIVTGVSSSEFAPDDDVTREQFAVILYRYAAYKGMTAVDLTENLISFADNTDISSYAVQAMNWAVGKGIITGKNANKLDPKGGTTRAEAAAMIVRYLGL